jgi:hypothetical protein
VREDAAYCARSWYNDSTLYVYYIRFSASRRYFLFIGPWRTKLLIFRLSRFFEFPREL